MRNKKVFVLCLILIAASAAFGFKSLYSTAEKPIHQLRIYQVPTENIGFFHERFRDHAHRIMKKYGFQIVSIWESKYTDKTEFVYLLEWKDEKTMQESWKNFMADQEWKDIKKVTADAHGTYVDSIEDRTLVLTDYSPQNSLLRNE
jgi:heme-degrading monooxygenase HmoA